MTFPLIARSTVAPLSVLAFTVVSNGVGEGDGFGWIVGFGVEITMLVGMVVEVGVVCRYRERDCGDVFRAGVVKE